MRDLQNTWLIVVRQSPPPDFVELTHASVTATAQNKIAPHVELLLDCDIAVARRQLGVELRCGQTPFNSVSMGEPCLCPLLKKVGLTTIPGIGIARNRFFSNILRNQNWIRNHILRNRCNVVVKMIPDKESHVIAKRNHQIRNRNLVWNHVLRNSCKPTGHH